MTSFAPAVAPLSFKMMPRRGVSGAGRNAAWRMPTTGAVWELVSGTLTTANGAVYDRASPVLLSWSAFGGPAAFMWMAKSLGRVSLPLSCRFMDAILGIRRMKVQLPRYSVPCHLGLRNDVAEFSAVRVRCALAIDLTLSPQRP